MLYMRACVGKTHAVTLSKAFDGIRHLRVVGVSGIKVTASGILLKEGLRQLDQMLVYYS